MTFKDQMKAAGKSSDAPTPESEDIAKLLRALNDDLKADPIDDVADLEDDDDEPKAARGGLPLGKIAAALLAAAGVGFAVVMLDPGGSPPSDPASVATAPLVPPAPAITRAPAANTTNPAPESLIARAPAPAAATPALPVPPPAAPAPTPPAGAAPMAPPPALKAPEPPALPPTAAPASTVRPAPIAKPAEPPHAAPPPAQTAAAAPPAPAAPAPKAVEPAPAKPAEPPAAKATETGALQAMLAPPKDPREPVKRPPPPAKPAEAKAAEPKAPEPKPAAVAKPLAPATGTLTVPIQSTPAAPPPAAPAPAPAAASAASDEAVPSGRYSVQVGSYQVAENAAIQVQKLKKSGFAAFGLEWTDSANKTWHVVRVGGYADKAAAQRAADDLKAKMGVPAYPVSAR